MSGPLAMNWGQYGVARSHDAMAQQEALTFAGHDDGGTIRGTAVAQARSKIPTGDWIHKLNLYAPTTKRGEGERGREGEGGGGKETTKKDHNKTTKRPQRTV